MMSIILASASPRRRQLLAQAGYEFEVLVSEADEQMLREATSKANLIHLAEQEESIQLTYTRLEKGTQIPYSLQTIRTRESDHHHIVIGVRPN